MAACPPSDPSSQGKGLLAAKRCGGERTECYRGPGLVATEESGESLPWAR